MSKSSQASYEAEQERELIALEEQDETGEDHGKGTYDCLEEPDQEPEAVESEGVELEW